MTFLEFIKSKLFDNSELGSLAKDIVHDPELPSDKSDNEIIGYLYYKSERRGTEQTLKQILNEFEKKAYSEYNNLYSDLINVEQYVVR